MNGSLAVALEDGSVSLIFGTYEDAPRMIEADKTLNIFVVTSDANVDEFKPAPWWKKPKTRLSCGCYGGPHGGYTDPACR